MATPTFEQLMQGFGVVTVMEACLYKLSANKAYVGRGACHHGDSDFGALTPEDFECSGLYLDTLKIANFTQEGPTKTITGGQYANPIIKYGKTMTCEMQDALGRAATLVEFFGCDYDKNNDRISITDKFPGAFCLEGKTFFIDQKTGEKKYVYILIPQFLPDAILTLTQDAEGDATTFDLNGSVAITTIADETDAQARSIFYEIREESWFGANVKETGGVDYPDWHEGKIQIDAGRLKQVGPQYTENASGPVGFEHWSNSDNTAVPPLGDSSISSEMPRVTIEYIIINTTTNTTQTNSETIDWDKSNPWQKEIYPYNILYARIILDDYIASEWQVFKGSDLIVG